MVCLNTEQQKKIYQEYIKEVTENPNIKTEILDVGDGLAISRF